MYKNIGKQTKLQLKDLVEYQENQVVSKTLGAASVIFLQLLSTE